MCGDASVTTPPVRHEANEDLKPNLLTLLRVSAYLVRPHAWLYATVLALCAAEATLGGMSIAALFPMFSSLTGLQPSDQGGLLAWIQRLTLLLPIRPPIVAAGCVLLGLALAKCLVSWSREVSSAYATRSLNHHLRKQVLDTYIRGGHAFFLNQRQGELSYNLHSACVRVTNLFGIFPTMVVEVVNIMVLLALLSSIHVKATAGLFVGAVSLHLLTTVMGKKFIFPLSRARKESLVAQQVLINEFINGFKQNVVFGAVRAWVAMQDYHSKRLVRLHTKESALAALPKNVLEVLVFAAGAIGMIWIGQRSPDTISAQVATFGVYLVGLQRMLPYVANLGRSWMIVNGYIPDTYVVYRTLRRPAAPRREGHRPAPILARAIRFDGVTFAYSDRGDVLRDANVVFERGKMTAIVGASGAGKTTSINLILGLFEPTTGAVLIDDVDLREIRLDSWLPQIGLVSQDTFIFNGTIRDNIAFFRECSPEEIEEAARLANAHDFIAESPEGYDTVVGDRGMKISGGQQQRIALARAILKKPEIFILDEATSSLDRLSESLIQDSIRKISVNRTVIVVAHRLSTIVEADRIFVLKDGRVVEEGTHAELLAAEEHYFRMYGGTTLPAAEASGG